MAHDHSDDQRRAEHADRVVCEQSAEHARPPDDARQQARRRFGDDDGAVGDSDEEAIARKHRAQPHHSKQQQQGVAVDGSAGFSCAEHAKHHAGDGSEHGGGWTIKTEPRHPTRRDQRVGHDEDDDAGDVDRAHVSPRRRGPRP